MNMNSYLKHRSVVIASVSIFVGLLAGLVPEVYAANKNPGVIPPNATPYGMTYGEWSAKWWQWAYSLPVDQNPWFDEEGSCANGAHGQFGPVWFLTGIINSSDNAERNCTVPAGKALFFPIVNVEDATLESGLTGEALREFPTYVVGLVTDLEAEIDGVPLEDLYEYRAVSPFSCTDHSPRTTCCSSSELMRLLARPVPAFPLSCPSPAPRGMDTI